MHVFVTGSESFIGKELVAACAGRGWQVSGADQVVGDAGNRFAVADIRSPGFADCIPEGTDVLVHLAAISRDTDCQADVSRAYEVNVVGTSRIAEAARQRGVKQVVFASSEWVYGDTGKAEVQSESDVIDFRRAKSEYALSKLAGEQILRVAFQNDWFAGLTILRFGIVYGPRPTNWSAVESIFHDICCRRRLSIGSRQTARRFIEVRDIASGIMASCGQVGDHTYNLSGDDLVSLEDIAATGFQIVGHEVPIAEKNPAAISIRNPANDLIRRELGWHPGVDLQSGLRCLYEYFEQEQLIECPA